MENRRYFAAITAIIGVTAGFHLGEALCGLNAGFNSTMFVGLVLVIAIRVARS